MYEGKGRRESKREEGSVFLGCSDIDPHIPLQRVHETASVLTALGGSVTERIYPGMGHTISEDEFRECRNMLATLGDL
ncbi:MAG TPA: hypothetical protein VG944_10095 [Fimbriimonas sp.]|nr:hypothetical protein [Fimbriimonas sp.]